jgi:Domain of unknown function (DUF4160)
MPAIKDIPGPYRFFFYSFDCNEPEHIHVQRENRVCKILAHASGAGPQRWFFGARINRIRTRIALHMEMILEAWHEHCG